MGLSKQGYECRQATTFAMELIMPKIAVEYLIMKEGITSVIELARIFDVSQVIMRDRLKQLGWVY